MKNAKLKFFSLFRASPRDNCLEKSVSQPNSLEIPAHFPKNSAGFPAKQPPGDRNLTEPANDGSFSSGNRSQGNPHNFSATPEEIGSERKYSGINASSPQNVPLRLELFNGVSKEIRELQGNDDSSLRLRGDSAQMREILEIPRESAGNSQRSPESQQIGTIAWKFPWKFPWKVWEVLEPVAICWVLALNSSIFNEKYVAIYNCAVFSWIVASFSHRIYERTLRETQYHEFLKELQVFRIDKERKTYILAHMRVENVHDVDSLRRAGAVASFLAGMLGFPLIFAEMGVFAVFFQTFLMICAFFAVSLVFRLRNNRKVATKPKKPGEAYVLRYRSKVALRDLSSSYLRFLQDLERNKTKILEKADFRNETASINFSNYLTKRTLEAGLQRNADFYVPIRAIGESFLCVFLAEAQIFLSFLLISALSREFRLVLAMLLCVCFAIYREIAKFAFRRYFLYHKLYKIFRVLTCFSGLLPFKLMFFVAEAAKTPPIASVSEAFADFCLILCVKIAFKVAIFAILFAVWFKLAKFLHETEQQKPSLRKNKRKRDKAPESIAASQFSQRSRETFNEHFHKKCKEFVHSFFIFNFADFLCTIAVSLSATTLHFIPQTRFSLMNSWILQAFWQYFGLELAVDAIIVGVLYFSFRKAVQPLGEMDWLGEGLKFVRKTGRLFGFALYFAFFLNFFCFDVYFLQTFQ